MECDLDRMVFKIFPVDLHAAKFETCGRKEF